MRNLRASALAIHPVPGHYIRRLQQVAVAVFTREIGEGGVTPVQYATLAAVRERGLCDQAALSALIGCDRATLGGVLDRLEAKGWVLREPSRADRRMKLVSLTRGGALVLRRIASDVERAQDVLMAPLAEPERATFERLCQKLLAGHLG